MLEVDIASCFTAINHELLIDSIPVDTSILRRRLNAGFAVKNEFFLTEASILQGGIISPVLANITLDGFEKALAKAFLQAVKYMLKMNMVRYADVQ